jgi:hypothetical protein
MAVAGASTASASVLVQNQGSTFFSMTEFSFFSEFQPIAEVVSGGNVNIGGFGVYGQAEAAGSIKYVVFDGSSLIYQSGIQGVSTGGARWFDSPAMSLTLTAGHTYSMGVIASNMFAWGRNAEPVSPITANGLTINAFEGLVQAPNTILEGGGTFAGDPIYASDWGGVNYFQGSVRVFDAGGGVPPIPEPSEWAMLLAGLMVVGFVAKRQRRRTI